MMRQEQNEDRLKDIVMVISAIGFLTVLIFIIGIVGGLQTDSLGTPSFIKRTAACLIIMTLSVRGICWSEKEDEYDNL